MESGNVIAGRLLFEKIRDAGDDALAELISTEHFKDVCQLGFRYRVPADIMYHAIKFANDAQAQKKAEIEEDMIAFMGLEVDEEEVKTESNSPVVEHVEDDDSDDDYVVIHPVVDSEAYDGLCKENASMLSNLYEVYNGKLSVAFEIKRPLENCYHEEALSILTEQMIDEGVRNRNDVQSFYQSGKVLSSFVADTLIGCAPDSVPLTKVLCKKKWFAVPSDFRENVEYKSNMEMLHDSVYNATAIGGSLKEFSLDHCYGSGFDCKNRNAIELVSDVGKPAHCNIIHLHSSDQVLGGMLIDKYPDCTVYMIGTPGHTDRAKKLIMCEEDEMWKQAEVNKSEKHRASNIYGVFSNYTCETKGPEQRSSYANVTFGKYVDDMRDKYVYFQAYVSPYYNSGLCYRLSCKSRDGRVVTGLGSCTITYDDIVKAIFTFTMHYRLYNWIRTPYFDLYPKRLLPRYLSNGSNVRVKKNATINKEYIDKMKGA